MEIRRKAAYRNEAPTVFVENMPISQIRFENGQIRIELQKVKASDGVSTHNYTVTLTPDDIGKIVAALSKQMLAPEIKTP